MTSEQYELIERMLLERIPLAGIARVLQISEDTVQRYVNAKAAVSSGRRPECAVGSSVVGFKATCVAAMGGD